MNDIKPQNLKITFLNAENLFLYLNLPLKTPLEKLIEPQWQKLSSANTANKELGKAQELARAILDMDPDILALAEVGGPESLKHFNELFLGNRYDEKILEGNSERGIDVGYLIKKDLGMDCEIWTHRDRPIQFLYPGEEESGKKSHHFSRDVAELRLFKSGDSQHDQPELVLLLTHLKSKLDPLGIDPLGKNRRTAELNTMIQIYNEIRERWTPKVPCIAMGDFNGFASPKNTGEEFISLYRNSDLVEVFDHLEFSEEDRTTQMQIFPGGFEQKLQIDYFFVSPELITAIDPKQSFAYRYKDKEGSTLSWPSTLTERMKMPSDHYPIVLSLNLKAIS